MEPKQRGRGSVVAAVAVLLGVIALVGWFVYEQSASSPEPGSASAYVHPAIGSSQTCISCKAVGHDFKHRVPYTGSCESCHSTVSWQDLHYRHLDADFNRSLHAVVGCSRCHTEGQLSPSPACQSCHAKRSPHKSGPIACGGCHSVVAWVLLRPLPVGHLSLAGGHERLSCLDCHKVARAAGAPARRCVDCHGTHHGGLTSCERCHEPGRGWKPLPGFDHAAFFPLVGRHRAVACASCHPANRFAGTPRSCSGCHTVVHIGLTKCEQCHTPAGFVPSTFNHSASFKITGRHGALTCSRCHLNGRYDGTPTRCVGCHGTKHGRLTACEKCHTTSGFRPSTFVHSSVFTLQGAHAKLACTKCHPNYKYASNIGGGGTACADCHGGPHGPGYTSCSSCHSTTAWLPTKAITHPGYIQLGTEHQARSCRLCHPTLVFSAPTRPCETSGCHAATIPHVGPTDCLRCHRPTRWAELHFTHPELTMHQGTNLNQQCLWCHPGRDYTKFDCKTCHVVNGIPWYDPFTP